MPGPPKLYFNRCIVDEQEITQYAGPKTSDQCLPVVLATDQPPIPITPVGPITVDQGTSPWVVSGTVTANQGTSPWLTSRSWALASGTDSVDSVQSGVWSVGRTWALASGTDSVTAIQGTSPWVTSISNFPATVAVTQSTSPWVVSGTVTANQGTSPWLTSRSWALASGTDSVAAVQSGVWSVNAVQSGAWTVTANAGTNLNTSALALDTTVSGLQVAQASTTSGQKGTLVQGAVTTSAPSYTTAQTNPLSLTTSGALRVDGSGSTQPVSGTVTSNQGTSPWVTSRNWTLSNSTDSVVAFQGDGWTVGRTWTLSSGTDSVNIGNFPATVAVTQSTSPWVVSGTVTANQGGAPWSNNVTQIGGSSFTLGQKTMANSAPVVIASDQTSIPASQSASTKATYSAAVLGATAALLATDIFTLTGSGTKTIKILRTAISAVGTAGVQAQFSLIKRSTANTGGTSTAVTAVSHDSTQSAATATTLSYTANPTLGTTVGNVRTARVPVPLAGAATGTQIVEFVFGEHSGAPIVLRGTGEVLAWNQNGVTIATASVDIYIEWTEE